MGIVGGGGQAELAVVHERQLMAVPGDGRLPGRRRPARGLHDRPRRALHPGRPAPRRAAARPRRRRRRRDGGGPARAGGRRARHRDGPQPRHARRGRRARRRTPCIDPEGFEEHGPFDVVLELVGAPNLPANLKALATGGRIVVIGVGAGAKAELNLLALMGKRGRIMASTLRARPLEEKAATARALEREVLPLFDRGAAARARRRDVRARRCRRRLRALRRPAASSARSCSTVPRTPRACAARVQTRRVCVAVARRSSAGDAVEVRQQVAVGDERQRGDRAVEREARATSAASEAEHEPGGRRGAAEVEVPRPGGEHRQEDASLRPRCPALPRRPTRAGRSSAGRRRGAARRSAATSARWRPTTRRSTATNSGTASAIAGGAQEAREQQPDGRREHASATFAPAPDVRGVQRAGEQARRRAR